MGLLAKINFSYLVISPIQNLSLLIATGIGAVLYFVFMCFMKIENVDVISETIKKKLGIGAAYVWEEF